jgi:hypothetical protein
MHDCCLVLIDCPLTFEAKLVRLLDTAVGAAMGASSTQQHVTPTVCLAMRI